MFEGMSKDSSYYVVVGKLSGERPRSASTSIIQCPISYFNWDEILILINNTSQTNVLLNTSMSGSWVRTAFRLKIIAARELLRVIGSIDFSIPGHRIL